MDINPDTFAKFLP